MSEANSPSDVLRRMRLAERSAQRAACDEAAKRLAAEPLLRAGVVEMLADPEPSARFAAAFTLFHGERPSLRVLAPLLDSLELPDGDVRWQAAHMLAVLGRLQPEVLTVLLHEAKSARAPNRRRMALYVLRELAPELPETANACLAALDDSDPQVRRAALVCVAKLGDPPRALAERALALARGGDADPHLARIATIVLPELARAHPALAAAIDARLRELEAEPDLGLARAASAARARLESAP